MLSTTTLLHQRMMVRQCFLWMSVQLWTASEASSSAYRWQQRKHGHLSKGQSRLVLPIDRSFPFFTLIHGTLGIMIVHSLMFIFTAQAFLTGSDHASSLKHDFNSTSM